MTRLFSLFFLFILAISGWAQQAVFQGRVELGRDLASFAASPPVSGTMYLLTGAAAGIRILSQDPFVAEVDFVQGEWKSESELLSHTAVLRFEGAGWSKVVLIKKPRQGLESVIFPYRKFQVAAVSAPGGFRALAIPVLF